MFMSHGLSCHCVFFYFFLYLPLLLEMVLATSYICSLFYLGEVLSLVLSGMYIYVGLVNC